MVDYWGLYDGKSREEMNPHQLKWGDLVVAPDGTVGRLDQPGFKWGFLKGHRGAYLLSQLCPYHLVHCPKPSATHLEQA